MVHRAFLIGLFFLISAQLMVGLNIVFSKLILSTLSVYMLLLIRFGLASLSLLPLHWLFSQKKQSLKSHFSALTRKDWFFLLAQALSAGVLFNWLMLLGLRYTDANVAGIITSALPALIAVLSWLLLGERLSRKKSLCVLFATTGLVIIACDKLQGVGEAHSFIGDVIILIALLPEATYYVLCKLHPNRLPVFLVSSLLNAINAIILLLMLPWMSITTIPWHGWDGIILLILGLSSGLFYVFWFLGCQRVDGIMASLSTATMPVSTVLFAWLLLKERLSLGEGLGMSLVIASIVVYARR